MERESQERRGSGNKGEKEWKNRKPRVGDEDRANRKDPRHN